MGGALSPAVAAVRVAVRECLIRQLGKHQRRSVLVACSGGADSLALAVAARFVTAKLGWGCGLVTIDHGLQSGSHQRATELVGWGLSAGFSPTRMISVDATARPGGDGPEGAARTARYTALGECARADAADAILLGHTRDDQSETVLLGLARGSGLRALAGMPECRTLNGVSLLRPLLDVPREQARTACLDSGLVPWDDPHNTDPSYARSRVRAALPALTELLGPGFAVNLARTASLVAVDMEYLDTIAASAERELTSPSGGLSVSGLAALPVAIRHRVLRRWGSTLGRTGPIALSSRHVRSLDALVTGWRGQGAVALPSDVRVERRSDQLRLV